MLVVGVGCLLCKGFGKFARSETIYVQLCVLRLLLEDV